MDKNNLNITDSELHEMLKECLLANEENNNLTQNLRNMQAKIVFTGPVAIAPPLHKEKELLSNLSSKVGSALKMKWIFTGLSVVAIATAVFIVKSSKEKAIEPITQQNQISNTLETKKLIIPVIDSTRKTKEITTTNSNPAVSHITTSIGEKPTSAALPIANSGTISPVVVKTVPTAVMPAVAANTAPPV